jgi:MEMO1 family protein
MDRQPAVAGMFYEGSEARLQAQVRECFEQASLDENATPLPMIGAVVPHAGLMYSGHVAAKLYGSVALPSRFIILCPNHTGMGVPVAINSRGGWVTPLGRARVDEELADELTRESTIFTEDHRAHQREHSLEVQLPFLQYLTDDGFSFVPVCMSTPNYQVCVEVGEAIARVVERMRAKGETVAILASSDMNHFLDQATTLRKDQRAIDEILSLSPGTLWDVVHAEDISMCGIIPATTMLVAANKLGATSAMLLRHATSGDVSGDYHRVVGYAAIVVA